MDMNGAPLPSDIASIKQPTTSELALEEVAQSSDLGLAADLMVRTLDLSNKNFIEIEQGEAFATEDGFTSSRMVKKQIRQGEGVPFSPYRMIRDYKVKLLEEFDHKGEVKYIVERILPGEYVDGKPLRKALIFEWTRDGQNSTRVMRNGIEQSKADEISEVHAIEINRDIMDLLWAIENPRQAEELRMRYEDTPQQEAA